MARNTAYIFIDASNLWEAQKARGRFLDYAKLRDFLKQKHAASAVQVFYYTAYPAEGTRPYALDGKHKFFTFLKKGLGFTVRKKELKRIAVTTEAGEVVEEKKCSYILRTIISPKNCVLVPMAIPMYSVSKKTSGEECFSIAQNRSNPPRGGLPLDVIPSRFYEGTRRLLYSSKRQMKNQWVVDCS